ncbi:site-2 protease family protein [Chloroflexota bacterium]
MLKGGIPIGKIFGIPLRLHLSWFLIFAFVIWVLSTDYFPDIFEDWSTAAYIITATITSLLFFSSVMLHELMHSVVARASGIPVESITLFIFGGVARITKEPASPKMEIKIALAGPLTSLLLGGTFWLIWYLVPASWEYIIAVAFWLGFINITLGVFNLLPGFPLDGGRVLRAILWWRSGNLQSATRWASNAGRGLGFIFIFGGVWLILSGWWFNGLWLAFIGWFIGNAAVGSYRQLTLQQMLQGHTVSEAMTGGCQEVPAELTLDRLVSEYILTSGSQCFVVTEDNRTKGVITAENVKQVGREIWADTKVSDVMMPFEKMKKVRPDEDMASVMNLLTQEDINELPVVEGDSIVGMIRRENLLAFINIRDKLGV